MTNKFKTSGIIVEYNPFHNGHIYHIQKTREITQCDVLIAVMSPNFVQRGEPAFISKWERVKAALEHGVDLVVELPTPYALQSADYFAKASVEILNIMNVDTIVFGSESADKKTIMNQFTFEKDNTVSYAQQMGSILAPNDILGYNYIKNADMFGIETIALKRTNSYHDTSLSSSISSASSIRYNAKTHDVSHTTPMHFSENDTYRIEDYEALIKHSLATLSKDELREILLVDEGIENLILKHQDKPLNQLIESCTSSKYTRSRITRTLMNILLNIRKNDVKPIKQVRVLGMTSKGQAFLKHIKNDAHYVTSFKDYEFKDIELKATRVYSLTKSQEVQESLRQSEIQTLIKM